MTTLSSAAAPPARGEVTRYETQCTWVTDAEDDEISQQAGPSDILIEVGDDPLFEHSSEALFLPSGDVDIAKKTFNALYSSGVLAALETLSEHKVDGTSPWPSKCSSLLLGAMRSLSSLHSSFYPHLMMSGEELLDQYSSSAHWVTCPVRAMQWHPHDSRLAVARKDNLVQVYQMQPSATSSSTSFQCGRMQQLKHFEQKRISSLAWRPYSGGMLAVGCQTGVMLWQVRSHPGAPRPLPRHLCAHGHSPVTSVAWSSDGRLLASASPADTSFMVWDASSVDCTGTPICRHGGGGVSLLAWSPAVQEVGMSRLLTATPSPLFRVWETHGFTCERWSNLAGRVTAACWSPDGNTLLFAMAGDPSLYYLTFFVAKTEESRQVGGANAAVKCADISAVGMPSAGDPDEIIEVGGCVQSMVWDKTGERLACTFTADSPGHSLVAVFVTKTLPVVEVMPCGFIRGRRDEVPAVIAFQNDVQQGSLLSVAWSSGRVAFVPLLSNTPLQSEPSPQTADGNTSQWISAAAVAAAGTTFSSSTKVAPVPAQKVAPVPARKDLMQTHVQSHVASSQSPLLLARTPGFR